MFFTAEIYGRTIKSETMQGIKLMATKIANGYHNATDEMLVTTHITDTETREVVKWTRINRKSPAGRIERGVWKWNTAVTTNNKDMESHHDINIETTNLI